MSASLTSKVQSAKARGHAAAQRNGDAFSAGDGYWEKLAYLIKQNKGREIAGSMRLPKPIGISVNGCHLRIVPRESSADADGSEGRNFIRFWFGMSGLNKIPIGKCSHVSQNYCCRCDVDGTSYAAFAGIKRRWMVIEADQGTLEQQFWLHMQLETDLGCLCWSGGKSLHGWYFVEGWTPKRCFDLFAKAIGLGVNDRRTWLMCTQARFPAGFNSVTGEKQSVLIWNL